MQRPHRSQSVRSTTAISGACAGGMRRRVRAAAEGVKQRTCLRLRKSVRLGATPSASSHFRDSRTIMDRRTLVCLLLAGAAPLSAQRSASVIRTDSLRANLFALAADSMGGRQTGSSGDWKAQEWVAAEFRAAGLEPAGESGGFFQVIP